MVQGEADLTGRHLERYKRLMARFLQLSQQFHELVSCAILTSGEETWGTGSYARTHTWYEYEFKDPEEWDVFSKRWHVPFGSAYRLDTCIRTYLLRLLELIAQFKVFRRVRGVPRRAPEAAHPEAEPSGSASRDTGEHRLVLRQQEPTAAICDMPPAPSSRTRGRIYGGQYQLSMQ